MKDFGIKDYNDPVSIRWWEGHKDLAHTKLGSYRNNRIKTMPAWDLHVEVDLGVCLGVGHHVINLSGLVSLNEDESEDESNCRPSRYWRIGLPVMNPLDLSGSVNCESCLVLVD